MKGLPFVLLFTAMTFLAWGSYGPAIHHGALAFNHDAMRAFVGVGFAYFLIAVVVPFLLLSRSGEQGSWTINGIVFSVVAGAVGALGALGIILAMGYGGQTVFVMPVVFGLAPVVNTLVTAAMGRTFNQIRPIFICGIVATALGASGVLFFKPPPGAKAAAATESALEADSPEEPTSSSDAIEVDEEESAEQPAAPAKREANWPGIIGSMLMAALCWGSYGPMLHIGQGKMNGSKLRPFACVGLAYFLIAVAAPLILIYSRAEDAGAWTATGMTWSIIAGVAGAVGALGVLLAFTAGGKPYYVMPLIFGLAPVVNTFISLTEAETWGLVKLPFWGSLAVVIGGAITVLTNAPKPAKPGAPPKPTDTEKEPASQDDADSKRRI
ncbi:MAG: hypothetical protein Aurels2KO_01080 [Aureliella sp.]